MLILCFERNYLSQMEYIKCALKATLIHHKIPLGNEKNQIFIKTCSPKCQNIAILQKNNHVYICLGGVFPPRDGRCVPYKICANISKIAIESDFGIKM